MNEEQEVAVTVGSTGNVFVGRERELDGLRAGLQDALSGRGRLFLIVGEVGIGKTRLAEELATLATAAGASVAWGRCWDGGGAPAYWPWVQIIRSLTQALDTESLRARLGPGAADIAQVVPEVAARLPDLEPPAILSADRARFQLFDSVTRLLSNVASVRPQVLVLDDLHAADVPSLLLLSFVAQELGDMPTLVVGIYQALDAIHDLDVDRALARLAQTGRRVGLRGLSQVETARFIEQVTGIEPSSGLAGWLHQATEGNPLFTAALTDLLAQQGHLGADIPPMRDRLEDQLWARQLLSEALEIASALGMEPLLAAISTQLQALGPAPSNEQVPTVAGPGSVPSSGVFRRQGEYWAISYGGRSFLLKDMKGLGYLAHLLARPDRELHVLDLVGAGSGNREAGAGSPNRANRRVNGAEALVPGFGDAGELLDHQAKAAYRRRLVELRQKLDQADDLEQAARWQAEMDFLTRELAAAVGLGGQDRRAASAAERARLNVTNRIRAAVGKIAAQDPRLGRHLDASIHTGTFCSYRPDRAAHTSWTT